MDKLLSIVMAIVLLFTAVANVIPVESKATDLKNTTLDSDISIEGTNSFGNMLSAELDSEVEEQEENNGYNVFSAEVAGTEVAVSFETMSDCTLLAAIYDEAGEKLIASGTAQVTEEEIEKTVTIEIDEMPQYFYLKVYLVDENTLRPMCTAYESPNYTQEMQEFFALTVDDFESDRVLNLDEDENNNFAVYNDETIIIESDETVNTVTAADIENENYVIENADSTVTSLQIGDVFVIEQTSGEILIVKVGEITIDGTTATITGVDTDMEEVFEIVKIDTTQTEESVDTSSQTDGVTYEGKIDDSMTAANMISGGNKKLGGEAEVMFGDTFSVNFTKVGDDDMNVTVSGSLSISLTIKIEFYYSFTRQYVNVTFEDSIGINLSITGKIKSELKFKSIPKPIFGINLTIDRKLIVEVSGSLSTEGKLTRKSGFSIDTKRKDPYKDLSSKPQYKDTLSASGTLFIGLVFEPNLSFLSKKLFKLGLEASVGVEISAAETYYEDSTEKIPEQKHECNSCIAGEICVKAEFSFNLKLLNSDKFSYKKTFASAKLKLFDFYISSTFGDQGFKTCPHQLYRLTIKAVDENGNAVPYAVISDGLNKYTADSKGKLIIYKKAKDKSTYKVSSGNISVKMEYKMPKESASITVTLKAPEVITQPVTTVSSTTTEKTTTETTTTTTDSSVVASGTCGENLTWVLDDEGTLTISGTGEMKNFTDGVVPSWKNYFKDIIYVVIEYGVTSIGHYAFNACKSLTLITIPDTVENIYGASFDGCESLISINVDNTNERYTNVNGVLFDKNMTKIVRYPEGKKDKLYVIPNSVTSIGISSFYGCELLTSIIIPDVVTNIGANAFTNCASLTEITIPSGVESLHPSLFYGCESLTAINISDGYTNAPTEYVSVDGVLYELGFGYTRKTEKLIKYPAGKTDESYIIPDSIKTIVYGAFEDCDYLTSIKIPDSVTSIEYGAFYNCNALTDVYYTGTEEQWNEITISSDNDDLTDATIHYNSTGEVSTASLLTMTKKSAKESALLTESFTDLLPNEVYNFYVMKSRAAESTFSGGNLLYATQAVSDENGELTISYIPKEAFETADIFVAGLTRTDISAAEATVPEITYIGEEILVNPDVTLNGQALIEGIDYDIEGGYLVTQPGDYTITIVGNGDYIGEKDIMFTAICIHSYDGQICMICGNKNPDILEFLLGDVNGDSSVDSSDASLVLAEYAKIQTGGAGEFTETQRTAADVNNDDVVDSSDASKILAYYAMVSTGKEPTWD